MNEPKTNEPNWQSAGEQLAGLLVRENAALAALEVPRAAAMLTEKVTLIAIFEECRPNPAHREAAAELLARLSSLAAENRRLLDRAIQTQGRVLGLLAGVMRETRPNVRYEARGRFRAETIPLTVSFSSNI